MIGFFFLALRSRLFESLEEFKVKKKLYKDLKFKEIDQKLISSSNPFEVSKSYLLSKHDPNPYQYGETPLMTLFNIAKTFGLEPNDVVYEMGSGRGRGAFMLAQFFKCQVIGIERIPSFVEEANRLAREYRLNQLSFSCGNMTRTPLKQPTYIYMYQTMLSHREIAMLIEKFLELPVTTKIITVSYSLHDYDPRFKVIGHMQEEFLFGKADVFLNVRTSV